MKQRRPRVCRRVAPVHGPLVRVCITDWRASIPVVLADGVPDPTPYGAPERA